MDLLRAGGAFALLMLLPSLGTLMVADDLRSFRVSITGPPGAYELRVNGHPFYVRGVSFTVNEAQEDPQEVLSPARLYTHFRRIRELGANTIRRYGISDDLPAILTAAERAGLMVMVGVWLDHDVDYLHDQRRLDVYRRQVGDAVRRFRNRPAVLMWVLGNETWGLLKREFPDPKELWPRRQAFYRFVNELAAEVKALDPHRPVMVVDEHIPDRVEAYPSVHLGIEASLEMFRQAVPNVDVLGINSYFQEDISVLDRLVRRARITRPYLVAEFGPPGYWPPRWTVDRFNEPVEPTDFQKVLDYAANWTHHIAPYRGWNLGGNAFVWKDKHEGSFTWFGLTDSRDRLKPAFWALREAWTGRPQPRDRPLVTRVTVNKRMMLPEESFVVRTFLLPSLDPTRYRYTYLVAPVSMTYVVQQFTTDLTQVSLQAPGIPGLYRLYVYATARGHDWVSTGSITFAVHERR